MKKIDASEIKKYIENGYICMDVRSEEEHDESKMTISNLATSEFIKGLIPSETKLLLHCNSGGRATMKAIQLEAEGFKDIVVITGP